MKVKIRKEDHKNDGIRADPVCKYYWIITFHKEKLR